MRWPAEGVAATDIDIDIDINVDIVDVLKANT
jgi:hypothetical protein